MPSADDLFRPTRDDSTDQTDLPKASSAESAALDEPAQATAQAPAQGGRRRPSGRVRHDEKMTVYVTSDELLDLEHARLVMRRSQGLAVDRGRLVREAVAIALADFEARGDESEIVQRLRDA